MSTITIPGVNFRFKISTISDLIVVGSPEYLVQDVPWKVDEYLSIYVYCLKEEPSNWSNAAFASFKLL